jgi:hypothetical protein
MEVDKASPQAAKNIQPVQFLDSDDRVAKAAPGMRCVCEARLSRDAFQSGRRGRRPRSPRLRSFDRLPNTLFVRSNLASRLLNCFLSDRRTSAIIRNVFISGTI